MDILHAEKLNGYTINIMQDSNTECPSYWGDNNLFLVGHHREFSVEGPRVFHKLPEGVQRDKADKGNLLVDKYDCMALLKGEKTCLSDGEAFPTELSLKYHFFPLEAYIHSGVVLAFTREVDFCDRQWDVSILGAVFVAKAEWLEVDKAEAAARGLIKTWNDYLSGEVYGYQIINPDGSYGDSCWGFFGAYDKAGGALDEARACIKHATKDGTREASGQHIFPFAQ